MDVRKLMEALVEDATSERKKRSCVNSQSKQTLQKIANLSIRGFERFLDGARRNVKVRYYTERITVEVDTQALQRLLDAYADDFMIMDDVDKLVMFGAPRSVIKEVTGAHHMYVASRRRILGVEDRSRKPRELSETEYAAVKKVWKELSFLGITDRLIMLSRITGLSIGNAWPVLKEEDMLGSNYIQTQPSNYRQSHDRVSEERAQYGRV